MEINSVKKKNCKIDNEVRFTKLISLNSKQDYDYYQKNKIKI